MTWHRCTSPSHTGASSPFWSANQRPRNANIFGTKREEKSRHSPWPVTTCGSISGSILHLKPLRVDVANLKKAFGEHRTRSRHHSQELICEQRQRACLQHLQFHDFFCLRGVQYGERVSQNHLPPPSASAVPPPKAQPRKALRAPNLSSSKSPRSSILRPTVLGFAKILRDIQALNCPQRKQPGRIAGNIPT